MLLLLASLASAAPTAPPSGVANAVVDAAWEPLLWADPLLLAGMTNVVVGPDGKEYLATVGLAQLKAGAVPTDVMTARRVAETKAKAALARFVGSTVETTTTMETERVTVQTTEGDAQVQRVARAQKVFHELTTERAQQALRSVRAVGSWTTDNGQTQAIAVVVGVPGAVP
jgi:hypothetical protein